MEGEGISSWAEGEQPTEIHLQIRPPSCRELYLWDVSGPGSMRQDRDPGIRISFFSSSLRRDRSGGQQISGPTALPHELHPCELSGTPGSSGGLVSPEEQCGWPPCLLSRSVPCRWRGLYLWPRALAAQLFWEIWTLILVSCVNSGS